MLTYLIFIMNVEWRGGGERIVEDKYQQRQRSESIHMFGGVSSRPVGCCADCTWGERRETNTDVGPHFGARISVLFYIFF